jgi:TusA-related sulfurtransferase
MMTDVPPVDVTVDVIVDAKGLLCPMPIVRLSKAAKAMVPDQVILLEATDPGSIPDVAAWARNTGNHVLHHDTVGSVMRFWIRVG